jgi:hypothetical protein
LATVTVGIPAVPAKTPQPRPPARPPVNKNAVKWGLIGAGAMIPPAMFVTAAYGVWWLVFPAFPLLFIELIVAIIIIPITLARQREDRSRMSRGQLPPRPGQAGRAQAGRAQAGRAVEAGRHGSTGPDPAPPGAGTGQTSADLRIQRSRMDRLRRRGMLRASVTPRNAAAAAASC